MNAGQSRGYPSIYFSTQSKTEIPASRRGFLLFSAFCKNFCSYSGKSLADVTSFSGRFVQTEGRQG